MGMLIVPPTSTHRHDHCSCLAPRELALLVDHRPVAPGPRSPLRRRPLSTARHADQIITGRLVTMDPDRPTAEAIAVSDGRIVGVGSETDIDGLRGPDTELLDLGDCVAYPGFVEPHMHLWASSMLAGWVDCSPMRRDSFDAIVGALRNAPPTRGDWTLGAYFDPSLVPGERELTRDILDAAVPDRPVFVFNSSLHYAYMNSAGLAAAGIDEDTPDPPGGGFFVKENGRLTGAMGESAIGAGMRSIPRAESDTHLDDLAAITRRAASRGVTKTHEAATGMVLGASEVDLLHSIGDRLSTRVSYAIFDAAYESFLASGLQPGAGDDMVRAVSWKIIGDGSNQGRSGYQYDDYLDRDFRGQPNHTVDYLAGQVALAHEHGWQVMIHANGDACIGDVLDAYEIGLDGVSGLDHRDRIEHCSVPTDDQLARMARLGLSPSFLMNHVYFWGRTFADNVFGPQKAGRLDPMRSALRHGLRPSMHSDEPVSSIDPLRLVATAVTRAVRDGGAVLNADECVTVDEAMRAVTIDAAWQTHSDDIVGSLEVGKYADLVVLDADPRDVDPEGIAEIGIDQTLLGGRPTFDS